MALSLWFAMYTADLDTLFESYIQTHVILITISYARDYFRSKMFTVNLQLPNLLRHIINHLSPQ